MWKTPLKNMAAVSYSQFAFEWKRFPHGAMHFDRGTKLHTSFTPFIQCSYPSSYQMIRFIKQSYGWHDVLHPLLHRRIEYAAGNEHSVQCIDTQRNATTLVEQYKSIWIFLVNLRTKASYLKFPVILPVDTRCCGCDIFKTLYLEFVCFSLRYGRDLLWIRVFWEFCMRVLWCTTAATLTVHEAP